MKTTLYLLRDLGEAEQRQRQAEAIRDFLALRGFDCCLCGPEPVLGWIASRVARPHNISLQEVAELAAPGGEETPAQFQARIAAAFEAIWEGHAGECVLVVAHVTSHRQYLSDVLHAVEEAVRLSPGGISIVLRDSGATWVQTLNCLFHLQGLA